MVVIIAIVCLIVFDVNNLTTIVVCGGKAASILHFQRSPMTDIQSPAMSLNNSHSLSDYCIGTVSVYDSTVKCFFLY